MAVSAPRKRSASDVPAGKVGVAQLPLNPGCLRGDPAQKNLAQFHSPACSIHGAAMPCACCAYVRKLSGAGQWRDAAIRSESAAKKFSLAYGPHRPTKGALPERARLYAVPKIGGIILPADSAPARGVSQSAVGLRIWSMSPFFAFARKHESKIQIVYASRIKPGGRLMSGVLC